MDGSGCATGPRCADLYQCRFHATSNPHAGQSRSSALLLFGSTTSIPSHAGNARLLSTSLSSGTAGGGFLMGSWMCADPLTLSLLCGCDGFNVAPDVSRCKQFFEIFSATEYVLSYVDFPLANQRRMYHNRSNEHTRKDYCWRNPPHSFLLDQVSTSVEGSRQGLDASMDR